MMSSENTFAKAFTALGVAVVAACTIAMTTAQPAHRGLAARQPATSQFKACGPGSQSFTAYCMGPGWWQSLTPAQRHAWTAWAGTR
jgi:hypothetical protein